MIVANRYMTYNNCQESIEAYEDACRLMPNNDRHGMKRRETTNNLFSVVCYRPSASG